MGRVWSATACINADGRKRLKAAKRNVRVIADIRQALRAARLIADIGQAPRGVKHGAVVRVSRIDTGACAIVGIDDRGPYARQTHERIQ